MNITATLFYCSNLKWRFSNHNWLHPHHWWLQLLVAEAYNKFVSKIWVSDSLSQKSTLKRTWCSRDRNRLSIEIIKMLFLPVVYIWKHVFSDIHSKNCTLWCKEVVIEPKLPAYTSVRRSPLRTPYSVRNVHVYTRKRTKCQVGRHPTFKASLGRF